MVNSDRCNGGCNTLDYPIYHVNLTVENVTQIKIGKTINVDVSAKIQ